MIHRKSAAELDLSPRSKRKKDRVARLMDLRSGGMTFSECGRIMGISKNAAIGLADRNNMTVPREKIDQKKENPDRNIFPERGKCLWPEGHPGKLGFHFCGVSTMDSISSYCAVHHRRVYIPGSAKEPKS